ncbi:heterokaryon incompatibility protein-domain-containing protein [Hypoxylon crocopeplum]|nr:heterokaryon incompatibility protein-domain-containing protein [Hypoxylon crocopeplum]
MNQAFCDRCRRLFSLENLHKVSDSSFRHGQIQTIMTNARNGCPFCGLMCHVKICEIGGFPEEGVPVFYEPEDWVWVHVWSRSQGSLIEDIEIEIEGEKDRGQCHDPASRLTSFRPIETDVASPAVIAAARKLISLCHHSHPTCRAAGEASSPSRVINVAGPDGSYIYLCSPRNLTTEGYVALSYCWGGDQPVKLLSNNKAALADGVPLTSLPSSLQDAVTCTRTLGYRYLWVDALCIMQDSEEDKLQEISKMASIYRNATVTITAAVASSVFEGYLGYDRYGSWTSKVKSSIAKAEHCHINIELDDYRIGTLTIIPKVEGRGVTEQMPLNKRGWCLQESILPRRLLYYGPQELLFRCQTIDCQPVIPSVIDYSKGIDPPRILSYEQRDSDPRGLWHSLVYDYSRREVSVAEDRVHALSGVTDALRRKWGDECLFGLWKSRFVEDLCWTSEPWNPNPVRSNHAPSWSWMSINCFIDMNTFDFENVDAVLNTISGNEVHLTCRIMTKSVSIRSAIAYNVDLGMASDEPNGKQVDYLYIGVAGIKHRKVGTKEMAVLHKAMAIAAIELEPGVFRRVGTVIENVSAAKNERYSNGADPWMQLIPRKIILV